MKWTRSSKALPSNDERVLAYSPAYEGRDNDSMLYRVMSGQFVRISIEVSHWAPLEPPADLEDEDYLP